MLSIVAMHAIAQIFVIRGQGAVHKAWSGPLGRTTYALGRSV